MKKKNIKMIASTLPRDNRNTLHRFIREWRSRWNGGKKKKETISQRKKKRTHKKKTCTKDERKQFMRFNFMRLKQTNEIKTKTKYAKILNSVDYKLDTWSTQTIEPGLTAKVHDCIEVNCSTTKSAKKMEKNY